MSSEKEKLDKAERFIQELKWRGLIYDSTDRAQLAALLAAGKKVYLGIDPTADFLHLGHYVGLSILKRFIRNGYRVVILIGSLTARIGDPSFRSKARKFNPNIRENGIALREQISHLFRKECEDGMCEIVDNYEFHNKRFLGNVNFQNQPLDVLLNFFSETCAHIKLAELFNREFLKSRIRSGLTLQELLYSCLQGWDFLYLHEQKNTSIQIGGSDQWGNMITGLHLISKSFASDKNLEDPNDYLSENELEELDSEIRRNSHAGIITFPIVNDSSGNKFGKSEGNAICISGGDVDKNVYAVRQYFLNSSDDKIKQYMMFFTDFPIDEIDDLTSRNILEAKAKLADEICNDIFGSEVASNSEVVSRGMFNQLAIAQTYESCVQFAKWLPTGKCIWNEHISIFSLFEMVGFVSSKSEFNRLIKSGGIYVSNAESNDLLSYTCTLKPEHVMWNERNQAQGIVVIRKGKKQIGLVHINRDTLPEG